jgi:hypothetical protein
MQEKVKTMKRFKKAVNHESNGMNVCLKYALNHGTGSMLFFLVKRTKLEMEVFVACFYSCDLKHHG